MVRDKSTTGKNDNSANIDKKQSSENKKDKKTVKSSSLTKQLETTKGELETLKDQYLRALAEFDNYKKRQERDFRKFIENANMAIIEELLPIVDDFERSFNSTNKKKSHKSFKEGIKLLFDNSLV